MGSEMCIRDSDLINQRWKESIVELGWNERFALFTVSFNHTPTKSTPLQATSPAGAAPGELQHSMTKGVTKINKWKDRTQHAAYRAHKVAGGVPVYVISDARVKGGFQGSHIIGQNLGTFCWEELR